MTGRGRTGGRRGVGEGGGGDEWGARAIGKVCWNKETQKTIED